MCASQTLAVPSIEERHVGDCWLLLFSLEHVEVLWPLSLLQDLIVYLGERLLYLRSIVSGQSQSLRRAQERTAVFHTIFQP